MEALSREELQKKRQVRDRLIRRLSALKTRADWKKYTQDLLMASDRAVERALLLLYSFQTEDERNTLRTVHMNGKGFDSVDARILSKLAKKLLDGGTLTVNETELARQRLMKYHEQISNVSKLNLEKMVEEQKADMLAEQQAEQHYVQLMLQLGA